MSCFHMDWLVLSLTDLLVLNEVGKIRLVWQYIINGIN